MKKVKIIITFIIIITIAIIIIYINSANSKLNVKNEENTCLERCPGGYELKNRNRANCYCKGKPK